MSSEIQIAVLQNLASLRIESVGEVVCFLDPFFIAARNEPRFCGSNRRKQCEKAEGRTTNRDRFRNNPFSLTSKF